MFHIETLEDELVQKTDSLAIEDLTKISTTDGSNKFCILPKKFIEKDMDRIKNLEVYEDDVWVVTFPKCGTTWTQEMVWMISSNLDYETAQKVYLDQRYPYLEITGITKQIPGDSVEMVKNMPRPRHIKSHLPLFLLPDQLMIVKPKIIYVARNPNDVAVSFYHHHINLHKSMATKEDYIEAFVKDLVFYSPMNDHILEFWKICNEPNILFLFFEDMKRNLEKEVRKCTKFLEKEFDQEQIDKLCKHLSFESIQKNDMVNKSEHMKYIKAMPQDRGEINNFNFIRKGQVGGYRRELTNKDVEKLNDYAKYPEFEKYGFNYKY